MLGSFGLLFWNLLSGLLGMLLGVAFFGLIVGGFCLYFLLLIFVFVSAVGFRCGLMLVLLIGFVIIGFGCVCLFGYGWFCFCFCVFGWFTVSAVWLCVGG